MRNCASSSTVWTGRGGGSDSKRKCAGASPIGYPAKGCSVPSGSSLQRDEKIRVFPCDVLRVGVRRPEVAPELLHGPVHLGGTVKGEGGGVPRAGGEQGARDAG